MVLCTTDAAAFSYNQPNPWPPFVACARQVAHTTVERDLSNTIQMIYIVWAASVLCNQARVSLALRSVLHGATFQHLSVQAMRGETVIAYLIYIFFSPQQLKHKKNIHKKYIHNTIYTHIRTDQRFGLSFGFSFFFSTTFYFEDRFRFIDTDLFMWTWYYLGIQQTNM